MTRMTMHSKTAQIELDSREVPEVGAYTKIDIILKATSGDSQFVNIYFDDLAIESLEQMRDALTAYLAENKVAANG